MTRQSFKKMLIETLKTSGIIVSLCAWAYVAALTIFPLWIKEAGRWGPFIRLVLLFITVLGGKIIKQQADKL